MSIPEKNIKTIEELEKEIVNIRNLIRSKRKNKFQPLEELLFRGQSNSCWKLETTLERYSPIKFSLSKYNQLLGMIQPAISTYTGQHIELKEFESSNRLLFLTPPNYEFMTYARQQGFPSPLLDWTASLYVALFFAFSTSSIENDIAIFTYIDTLGGIKSHKGDEPIINRLGPYITSHKRHFSQQAQYTASVQKVSNELIYGSHEKSCNKDPYLEQEIITKYVLPGNLKEEVLSKLFEMNINAYSLYSSNESLMEMLAYKEITLRNQKDQI